MVAGGPLGGLNRIEFREQDEARELAEGTREIDEAELDEDECDLVRAGILAVDVPDLTVIRARVITRPEVGFGTGGASEGVEPKHKGEALMWLFTLRRFSSEKPQVLQMRSIFAPSCKRVRCLAKPLLSR